MNHYRMFLANLENLFMKCCKKIDPSILNSKEIIKSILNKGNIALFRNAQAIIHLICVACVKVSVENVSAWYHGMKNTVILHDSLPSNIIWTKWSLLRADLYYIMLLKYLKKQWTSISIKWHFLCWTEYMHSNTERLSESCWAKSLNYYSFKTVHVRYDIF